MKRFMVDLETLGINPGCVILSIGAVRFDSERPGDWFYSRIDLHSARVAGLRVESDTLMWWFRHGEAAIEHSALGGDHLADALNRLALWFGHPPFEVWGNGCTFDNEILRFAFNRCGIPVWERRADRCFRTLVGTSGAGVPMDYAALMPLIEPPCWWPSVPRHHALRDAACQAAYVESIFHRCGLPL